jgi:hypothetical protein
MKLFYLFILRVLGFFIKKLFHAQYIMSYILIQVNDGIVNLVTLMVKNDEIISKMKVLQLHFKVFFK